MLFFAADPRFNEGVVGLAASRLVESYYRPSIVAHQGEVFTVASCRSIPEFHITQALDACADLLVRHGGHSAAAGFTVRNENLPLLKERLLQAARDQLGSLDLRPALTADWEFPLQSLTPANLPDLLDQLDRLQPTGMENPEPLFVSRNLAVRGAALVGAERAHLKFFVQANGRGFPAIAFRQGHWHSALSAGSVDRIDIIYSFEMNEFSGSTNLQLNVKDIRPSGAG
jgi:single-stranded-DNA-specific exonuclease